MRLEPLDKYVSLSQGLVVNKSTEDLFSDKCDEEHPYPLLRIIDFENGNHANYSRYVSKQVPEKVIIDESAILFTRVTCQCFRGFSGVFHNNLFKVELTNKELCEDYLYAVLCSDFVRKQALRFASSSVVPDLSHTLFKSILIPVPDIEKQQFIADILLNIDAKIKMNSSIFADLEALAMEIYDYWFTQFDYPNENGKPYKSSGGKMVWNEKVKREIPEGWEIHTTGEYINIIRGVSYNPDDVFEEPEDGYIPLMKSNNLQNGRVDYNNPIYVPEALVDKKQYLTNNSIFVTMSSGSTEHVGKTAIVPFDSGYCFGAFCSKIELNPDVRCLLSMFFTSDYFKRIIHTIVVGTNIKNISNEHLTNNYIVLPADSALIKKFEEKVNPILDKMGELTLESQQLIQLRDFLLPMLMNGQIKIGE